MLYSNNLKSNLCYNKFMKEYDFYIVPTPIGNLSDITLRAVEILKSVDLIACEDSRVTQKLLNHFNIGTKCISYHKYNEHERINRIIEFLQSGKKMALVSDAGTPLICDPGSVIVKELRNRGFSITALPGANAIVTFLSQISREDECFNFIGFLPKTQNQIEKIINENSDNDLVFYDSPNRILTTLKYIKNIRPDAKVAIGRELTKIFEEILVNNVEELISHFEQNQPKGEFVVLVFRGKNNTDEADLLNKIKSLRQKGYGTKDISVILSTLYGYNKNQIYKLSDLSQ